MDFESSAFANSATPARRSLKLRNQKRSSNASDLLNRDAHHDGKHCLRRLRRKSDFGQTLKRKVRTNYCTGVRRKACVWPWIVP